MRASSLKGIPRLELMEKFLRKALGRSSDGWVGWVIVEGRSHLLFLLGSTVFPFLLPRVFSNA